jgi:hypothetical protein
MLEDLFKVVSRNFHHIFTPENENALAYEGGKQENVKRRLLGGIKNI